MRNFELVKTLFDSHQSNMTDQVLRILRDYGLEDKTEALVHQFIWIDHEENQLHKADLIAAVILWLPHFWAAEFVERICDRHLISLKPALALGTLKAANMMQAAGLDTASVDELVVKVLVASISRCPNISAAESEWAGAISNEIAAFSRNNGDWRQTARRQMLVAGLADQVSELLGLCQDDYTFGKEPVSVSEILVKEIVFKNLSSIRVSQVLKLMAEEIREAHAAV